MKAPPALACLPWLLVTFPALGDDTSAVPPIVGKGFEQFQRNGTLAATSTWLEGSSRANDDDQDRATAKLNAMQGIYGRMIGYELVRTVSLSPSTERVYAAVKFEKGVAWMSFDCYRPDSQWIVSRFDFGTNANLILPPNILGGQR